MSSITSEKYVSLTSYKRDGDARSLPVWIVDVGDGRVGFTTSSSSFKVKRIGRNPAVLLQPCNAKGDTKEGSEAVGGSAQIVTGSGFEEVRALVKKKYGVQMRMITLVGKLAKLIGKGSGTDCAVVVTLT